MSLTGWRIVKAKRAATAFDGEGSRRFGGRFNSPGVAVVYVASALSLAILELLVHIDRWENLERYVAIPVTFDERISRRIAVDCARAGMEFRFVDDGRRRRSAMRGFPRRHPRCFRSRRCCSRNRCFQPSTTVC